MRTPANNRLGESECPPAEAAGTQCTRGWIPAFAGMTRACRLAVVGLLPILLKSPGVQSGLFLIALTLPLAAFADGGVPGPYMWPLEGKTNISAGFCDYRTRHFHGGIDISTGGQEGFPVRAADSGWVLRVATSYWGFGKVVYIHLAGGRVAVYGHLSELAPKIQQYVEQNQYATERYLQNLLPAPGQIPIARSEIIGKTGQSGAGPPHLHFELRTGRDRPLNPLVVAFQKPDKTAPSIHSITVIPRQPDRLGVPLSLVDGKPTAQTYDFSGLPGGRVLAAKPEVSGVVGISVRTDDIIDGPDWIVSVYHCRLWANDSLVCEVRHDSIDYRDTRLIELERLYDGRPSIAERPINLYRRPGNQLWNYVNLANDGWLEVGKTLRSGVNQMRLEIEDAAGNSAFADFQLTVEPASPPATTGTDKGGELLSNQGGELLLNQSASETSPAINRVEWFDNGVLLQVGGATGGEPACFLDYGLTKPLEFVSTGAGKRAVWLPAAVSSGIDSIWIRSAGNSIPQRLRMSAISPADGGTVTSGDGHATVQFGPGDLYEPSFFQLAKDKVGPKARKPLSEVYSLQPADVPFVRAVKMGITFDPPSAPAEADSQRVALYRYRSQSGDWEFVGMELSPDRQTITGKIESPGTFALLSDRTPPTIRNVTPAKGEAARDRQPIIRLTLTDDLSGIGSDADIRLAIDGHWTVVEYDPETTQAKAQPRRPLSPGDHRVEISAKDRMGNETKFQRTLTIVK